METRRRGNTNQRVVPRGLKRSRVVMSLDNKVRVLNLLRSGNTVAAVGRLFKVNESTIRSIRQKEDHIRRTWSKFASANGKVAPVVRLRSGSDEAMEKMEKRLNLWVVETIARNESTINTAAIRRKAKQIYEHVTQYQENVKTFSASTTWLNRFKTRYGLKNLNLHSQTDPADAFVKLLSKIIKKKNYMPAQVFNANETSFFYKQINKRTGVAKESGFKDRATMLFCANAEGDFKCKPLMVYKSQNPRALKGKNLNHLPVIWKWNLKAWMSGEIFWDWFNNHFIPEVEKYLERKRSPFKVLLILDSARVHVRQDLENAHPNVEVLFIPPTTSQVKSLQPLGQGVIKAFKSYYIHEVYRNACQHLDANPRSTMIDFWKLFTILDVIDYVKVAWERVSQATINNCWEKVWPQCVINFQGFRGVDAQIKKSVATIMGLAQRIGEDGFDTIQEKDIDEILMRRAVEPSNEELVVAAMNDNTDSDSDHDEAAPKIRPLSVEVLKKWAPIFEQATKEFLEADPSMERSVKFKDQLEDAFRPYAELLKEIRWKSRQKMLTLTELFKRERSPPSHPSSSRNQINTKEEEIDISDCELLSLSPASIL